MKNLKHLLAIMILICWGAFSAQAQLGKLKEKADKAVNNKKDKIKQDVEKKVDDKIDNKGNSATPNSTSPTSISGSDTKLSSKNFAIPNIDKPTVEFATDYTFKNKKTNFEPGEEILVRLITPKPMGEMFKEAFKMQDIPMSGAMAIAIAKDADDEDPIVITQYAFFPNRYKDDKQFAFTLARSG